MTDTDNQTTAETHPGVETASSVAQDVIANVGSVIVDNDAETKHVVTALLGEGHVLVADVPGVGKTMLAKSVARSFGGEFGRVQFTPDLLPADVTGVSVYDEQTQEFTFRPGPIFGNVVLADEIDRAPPKTQSALLEAMEEGQTTVDGETHDLPEPFTVIATQNTVEGDGAYPLPVAELDRFTKRLELGYPGDEAEVDLYGRAVGEHPIETLAPVATPEQLRAARETRANVTVSPELREYVSRLVRYTREHARLGVSPRGGIDLLRTAQARALLDARGYVVPDDIQTEAPAVLAHRVRVSDGDGTALVADALDTVPIE